MEFDGLGVETARYFYHTDHLGSVRLLTDAGGSPVQGYEYSAYGMRVYDPKDDPALYDWSTDATLNPFTYTGREYHAPSGLYFYRARFYDPEVGKFLSVDPVGLLGGVNTYRYVGNNPLDTVDPLGLWGIQFGEGPNIGLGQPTLIFDISSVYAVEEGAYATLDGIVPFIDPFGDKGFYDRCDPVLGVSRTLGAASRNLLIAAYVSHLAGAAGEASDIADVQPRTTRQGEPGVRIIRRDGSVKDITPRRVKEFVPEPRAEKGLRPVKFPPDVAIPGSKGKKRPPTAQELEELRKWTQ